MIRQQTVAVHHSTIPGRGRRKFLGASIAAVATLMLTACGGIPTARPAAAVPPAAPQVVAQPATAPTSAPAIVPNMVPASNSIADASTAGPECPSLTAADVKALTGEDVRPVAPKEFAIGGNTCGNYVNAAGKPFVSVRILTTQQAIDWATRSVPTDVFKVHEQPNGLGDQADFYKDQAPSPTMRYLVVRKGGAAVELMPFTGARSLTDEQLFKLAIKALQGW
jgi:hypothetical protein